MKMGERLKERLKEITSDLENKEKELDTVIEKYNEIHPNNTTSFEELESQTTYNIYLQDNQWNFNSNSFFIICIYFEILL